MLSRSNKALGFITGSYQCNCADTHVRKWGWFFTVSSSFSKKVVSVASPGLRHSSSYKHTHSSIEFLLFSAEHNDTICHCSVYPCSSHLLKQPLHKMKPLFSGFFPLVCITLPQFFHLRRCFQLTRIEMMPLNFSSTKSQIILLLKYWTGSHCKDKKPHFGWKPFWPGKNEHFWIFQAAPHWGIFLSTWKQSFFTPEFAFLRFPLESIFF